MLKHRLSSSYFPLSAINNSISCSLIPTIASPRSLDNSAIRLASVSLWLPVRSLLLVCLDFQIWRFLILRRLLLLLTASSWLHRLVLRLHLLRSFTTGSFHFHERIIPDHKGLVVSYLNKIRKVIECSYFVKNNLHSMTL